MCCMQVKKWLGQERVRFMKLTNVSVLTAQCSEGGVHIAVCQVGARLGLGWQLCIKNTETGLPTD